MLRFFLDGRLELFSFLSDFFSACRYDDCTANTDIDAILNNLGARVIGVEMTARSTGTSRSLIEGQAGSFPIFL